MTENDCSLSDMRLHTTWMKNIHEDLSSLDLRTYEASRDLAQNRRLIALHTRSGECYYWTACVCEPHYDHINMASRPTLPRNKTAAENATQITTTAVQILNCLQCFDAVGWAAGRASGL